MVGMTVKALGGTFWNNEAGYCSVVSQNGIIYDLKQSINFATSAL